MHPKDVPFKEFRLILQRHARPRHSLFRTFTRTRHVFRRVSSFSIVREKFTDRWVKLKKNFFASFQQIHQTIHRWIKHSNGKSPNRSSSNRHPVWHHRRVWLYIYLFWEFTNICDNFSFEINVTSIKVKKKMFRFSLFYALLLWIGNDDFW